MPYPKFSSIHGTAYAIDIDTRVRNEGDGNDIISLFDNSTTVSGNPGNMCRINDVYATSKVMFAYDGICLVVVRRADKKAYNFKQNSEGRYRYSTAYDRAFDYLKESILHRESIVPVSSQIQSGVTGAFETILTPVIDARIQAGVAGAVDTLLSPMIDAQVRAGLAGTVDQVVQDTRRLQAGLMEDMERHRFEAERLQAVQARFAEEMERQRDAEVADSRRRMDAVHAAIRADMERQMQGQATMVRGVHDNTMQLFRSAQDNATQLVQAAQANMVQLVQKQTAEARKSAMFYTAVGGCILCMFIVLVCVAAGIGAWFMMSHVHGRIDYVDGRVASNTGLVTNGHSAMDGELVRIVEKAFTVLLNKNDPPPTITFTQPAISPTQPTVTVTPQADEEEKPATDDNWTTMTNVLTTMACTWGVICVFSRLWNEFVDK